MSAAPLPSLPTLREELDRKSFATLDWLFTSLEQGKLTPEQFSTGIDALFMATAGLVDQEITTIVTGASGMARKGAFKRILLRHEVTCMLTRVAGASSFLMTVYQAGKQVSERVQECDSSQAAKSAMERLVQAMVAKGYVEI